MTCKTSVVRRLRVFLIAVGCIVFSLGFESEGWCSDQGSKGAETSGSNIGKYLPVSFELSQLIMDMATKKDELEDNYSNDPERLKEELSRLGQEFRERWLKVFEEKGITEEEYITWVREGLNRTEELGAYLQEHPEMIEKAKTETPEDYLEREGYELIHDGLIAALDDERARIRRRAAKLLGKAGVKDVIPTLQAKLQDSDMRVKIYSASSLCMMGDYSGVPLLLNMSENEDRQVRLTTIPELTKCKEAPEVLPALIQMLQDENKVVRFIASTELARMQDPQVLEALEKAIGKERDGMVRSFMKERIRIEKQIRELTQ